MCVVACVGVYGVHDVVCDYVGVVYLADVGVCVYIVVGYITYIWVCWCVWWWCVC